MNIDLIRSDFSNQRMFNVIAQVVGGLTREEAEQVREMKVEVLPEGTVIFRDYMPRKIGEKLVKS